MREDKPTRTRRDFLRNLSIGGGSILLASCAKQTVALGGGKPNPVGAQPAPAQPDPGPLEPTLPDGLARRDFHVHNEKPLGLETRRSKISSSIITPASLFFVRNNLPMPPQSIKVLMDLEIA